MFQQLAARSSHVHHALTFHAFASIVGFVLPAKMQTWHLNKKKLGLP